MRALAPSRPLALSLALALCGCAATSTAISKRNLDVQTKMSDTIFLDPRPAAERTVFIELRNTSDKPDLDIEPEVRAALESRGHRVVSNPAAARYLLQANVLQVGRTSEGAADSFFAGGFGSSLLGAAVGAGAGRAIKKDTAIIAAGAVIGATAAAAADAFIQDVTYSIITDIQISERVTEGVVITESMHADLADGSSARRTLSSVQTSQWKRWRTRVMSKANQVNLDFDDAAPALVDGLTRSIAGVF
jgi:hypothetical protein